MKKLYGLIFVLLIANTMYAAKNNIDWNTLSYETVTLICQFTATTHIVRTWSSSKPLDFKDKSCAEAISYIKNIAAYPTEYINIDFELLASDGLHYVYYTIEYLSKK